MNKLSYGLLSFLSTEPLTGYDLMLKLNQIWNTTHSAIYPLLAELEEKKYVAYTIIGQNSKPDKKVYEITELGREVLKAWIASPTDEAVRKDEMMLKIYCMQGLDKVTMDNLLDEMEARYGAQLEKYTRSLEKIIASNNNRFDSYNSSKFGTFVILQKVICDTKTGISWCKWLRSLCNKASAIDCSKDSFEDFEESTEEVSGYNISIRGDADVQNW